VRVVESERNFRLLVRGVTDYALYMLDPQGYVSSWNAGGERIKGYAASEIIGQHFSCFYTPSDRAAQKPARALRIAREKGNYQEDGWRVRKDGSFFWASVVIDPIYDDDGTLLGFAKITRDISERRNSQLALEKMQRQLAESRKMDAIGQLTGGVAHDFNNLLMVITGNVQVLKRLGELNPRVGRAIDAIEMAAQRGAGLTRQLLTFSRRQQLNPQVVEIGERIDAVRDLLDSTLDGNELVIDIVPDAWPVTVDIDEFEIALVNLAVNARDALPGGGTVTVSARNVRLDNSVRFPAGDYLTGDYLALTISDTGIGIPQDMIERVFDPFFTTKAHGKGNGLGLSQVHGFAHQAGGSVTIASAPGEGTSLTLYLPRATRPPAANDADPRRIGTVLLVEDNPDVADASAVLLEKLGYTVHWVADGETALARIEDNGYDLVVSDVVMSGHPDGVALARLIRQRYPNLPILLATGYSEVARAAGGDFTILHKPYAMHELSQSIAKVMAMAS
jgi:PAS domain S-box-containing protein